VSVYEERLAAIQGELGEIKKWLMGGEVKAMLVRRGLQCLSANPNEYLAFPPDWDQSFEDEIYDLLKKYSFRLFFRDVIKKKDSFTTQDLVKYATHECVEKYLDFLLSRKIAVKTKKGAYRLKSSKVSSFGYMLEWFVSKIFEREFYSSTLWGVKLKDTTAGGDYDVIASVEGNLTYIEVKSSPPKHVEEKEVATFLERVEELNPHLAIFLEDTQLRMKDKIVPFFEEIGKQKGTFFTIKRLTGELFTVNGKIFIVNSHPDLVNNLGLCLKYNFLGRL
jgi:hypothetical protein